MFKLCFSTIISLAILSLGVLAQNSNTAVQSATPEPAKSKIRARVFYEDTGRPVRRTSVMLVTAKGGSGREGSGVTDELGNLEVKNLRAGKYYAIINAPGVVSPMAYININQPDSDSLIEQLSQFPFIEVNGISEVVAQIPARRGGAISGRITYPNGDVAIGVKVEILRKVGDAMLPVIPNMSAFAGMLSGASGFQTDDRGMYRFPGLPAGDYYIRVSENIVHASASRSTPDAFESIILGGSASMVTLFFPDAFEKDKAQTIPVQFGQEVPEVNLVIPDRELHTLAGKVVAAHDKLPIRKARVRLQKVGDDSADPNDYRAQTRNLTYTDGEGNWQFTELPTGKFKVVVEPENSAFDPKDRAYGTDPDESDTAVNMVANAMNTAVAISRYGNASLPRPKPEKQFAQAQHEYTIEDKDLTDQSIELKYGSRISGTVTMEGGDELPPYVTFAFTNLDLKAAKNGSISNYGNYDEETETRMGSKAKDDFEVLSVPAGKTELSLSSTRQDFYIKKATAGGVDLLKDPVVIKEGEDLLNVQIVLAKDVGTLAGTVIDGEKEPIPGMQLIFVPTDQSRLRNPSFYKSVRADENGNFEIKLPPFEYALVYPPAGLFAKSGPEFSAWLANNIKQAQTFKIEAGQTTKATIKHEKGPPK